APQAGGTAALRLHRRHRGRHALPQERQGPRPLRRGGPPPGPRHPGQGHQPRRTTDRRPLTEQPSGAPTMPSDDSSVRDALNHQSLKVSRDDPGPRPMIAVLDARPGLAGQLREKIAELAPQVRRDPGRFYLYEVYASAAAFAEHLQTQPVHDFIAAVPALSAAQPGSLVQLDEIT